jgi:hypothetical protein
MDDQRRQIFQDDLKLENEDIEKEMDDRIDYMMDKGYDNDTIINELSGGSSVNNNYEEQD